MSNPEFAVLRRQMIAQIAARTIFLTSRLGKASLDRRVLDVIGKVPRHDFVRVELQSFAYDDMPLPSGYGKTISQPFIVALMTDLLDLQPTDIVLEVGTGPGYQTAILAALARHVYSVELIEGLAIDARQHLARQGCTNVDVRVGDGHAGWPDHAPFDKIIVTAAPDLIPRRSSTSWLRAARWSFRRVCPMTSNSFWSKRTRTPGSPRARSCRCGSLHSSKPRRDEVVLPAPKCKCRDCCAGGWRVSLPASWSHWSRYPTNPSTRALQSAAASIQHTSFRQTLASQGCISCGKPAGR